MHQPSSSSPYRDHVRQVIEHWALLAGVAHAVRADARMSLVDRQLARLATGDALSALCADGSPVEFCERIGPRPQAPALTVAGFDDAGGGADFDRLQSLVRPVLGADGTEALRRRVGALATSPKHLWLGIDFAQPTTMRLYCKPAPKTVAAITADLAVTDASRLFGPGASSTRAVLAELVARGRNLVVGFDFAGSRSGSKLAVAHPLERSVLARVAAVAGVALDPLAAWLEALRPGRPWPTRRCGLGLAIDPSGRVTALTAYVYAAPFFRGDDELRSFVLRLAARFGWNTGTYRHASRLLDHRRERRRHLIGFTTSLDGSTSLRTYAQTGIAA